MSDEVLRVLLTCLLRAVAAILLAIVFQHVYRRYRRGPLRHWTWCWWALGVYLLASTLALYLELRHPSWDLLATAVDFFAVMVLGFGLVIWLLEEGRQAAHASDQIAHLAYHDSLTGLANRQLLLDRLTQAIAQAERRGDKIALLFLDLDRFKVINDSLGHGAGDELLRTIARRLARHTRKGDTVARLGGDEFTLMIPRIPQVSHTASIASNLLTAVAQPLEVSGQELQVTTSIGISVYPDDGLDAETLLKNADLAMYRAKELGRNLFQLYSPALHVRAHERLALEIALRKALEGEELVIFYLPILDLRSERLAGVEALVRWQHAERGLLSPSEFLLTAENLGLLEAIDHWVLQSACLTARRWQRQFGDDLALAVNFSARPFHSPDFAERLRRTLAETGLEASRLAIEITENVAMQDLDASFETLRQLKQLGVRIAIDDFGTGHSSLHSLRRLPIDKLKLDHHFISGLPHDPIDAAIVSTLVALGHSLDILVAAEGVENLEQRDFLARCGCDELQGRYFHPPLPAGELEDRLRAIAVQRA